VANPGFYPLKANDSIETLVQASGGATINTDSSAIKLYISEMGDEATPQKININRAEVWLLEALPGIGEERGKAIVDYRLEHGLFRNISELTKVTGIGSETFKQVKPLISVAD
jgi:competence protein ComEA